MKLFIILIFIFIFSNHLCAINELDSLINQLEYHMDHRKLYDLEKESKIKQIEGLKNEKGVTSEQLFIINSKLITEYEAYIFDSALYYLEKNLKISRKIDNPEYEIKTKISMADLLASSGRYEDALEIMGTIKGGNLHGEILVDYYRVYRNVYSILTYYTPVKENRITYNNIYVQYTDSLLTVIDHNSEEYLAIEEKKFRDSRKLSECLKVNTQRLVLTHLGERAYSLATFERALVYQLLGDTLNHKKYLILSAISDIKFSVKDNASLAALATLLNNEQQLEKAFRYINFSYEDASFFNSRLRFTLISNILPIINDAYHLRSTKQKNTLRLTLLIISLLSIGLFISLIFTFRQNKNLSKVQKELKDINNQLRALNADLTDVNNKLNESNKVKEHYIGNFLSICSNYIDKLDKYRRMVSKHIINRQVNELLEITKSSEFIERETKEFYDNFDTTFLHIFPNFVERINSLLAEDEKIELKHDELLNTELRIYALIRLGITDSQQMATLLRYSIRTIYNYRVKIKNKALVTRDDFDDYVMKIGAFSK